MKNFKEQILHRLIDKYEKSKSFIENNKVNQSFSINLGKEFPEYADDANVESIKAIEDAVTELEDLGFIVRKSKRNGILEGVKLNKDALDKCYEYLKRTPKKDENDVLRNLLSTYAEGSSIVALFCCEQLRRISENKKAECYTGDINTYADLLKALSEVDRVERETFIRDFSIKIFGDSKKFEKIKNTVITVLYKYGDFPEKETVLEDLNIVKNPGHVYFKGAGTIVISGQKIDLRPMDGDFGVSSSLLKDIDEIVVTGNSVVTIENLTTFNMYPLENALVIYLGGYLNTVRGEFIKRIHELNPDVSYYHYGDIDAGGFYILRHLREKTGIDFTPLHMDIETLKENKDFTKQLTENDRIRLKSLLNTEFETTIRYMLDNNCKLEQEALDGRA